MLRTLAALRAAAKFRADMVSSPFVTDPEWLTYLNGSAAWLHGLLTTKFEDYSISTDSTVVTDGTNDRYALPTDFLKLRAVDLETPGTPTGWVSLRPFTFAERNRPSRALIRPWGAGAWMRYRLNGTWIWLAPLPPAGQRIRIHYTPQIEDMVVDTDTIDGVNGWEELVVLDAARKALLKEESDTSGVEREIAVLVKRIEDESQNRDAGEPASVSDVERGGFDPTDPWWP